MGSFAQKSSFLLEKVRQQREAFVLHYTSIGFRLWMQHFAEAREAVFLVVGSPYDFTDMGMAKCAGAHGARLQGDVERAFVQIFCAQGVGRCGDGEHLGVGGNIVEGFGLVVGAGDDLVVAHHDGPDGDFVGIEGGLCLLVGLPHIGFV